MLKHTLLAATLLLTAATAHAAPRLEFGPAETGTDVVTIPLTLIDPQGKSISALGVDMSYDVNMYERPAVSVGPAATAAGKVTAVSAPAAGRARAGVLGYNAEAIGSGVVAVFTFKKKSGAGVDASEFRYALSASDSAGQPVTVEPAEGTITAK